MQRTPSSDLTTTRRTNVNFGTAPDFKLPDVDNKLSDAADGIVTEKSQLINLPQSSPIDNQVELISKKKSKIIEVLRDQCKTTLERNNLLGVTYDLENKVSDKELDKETLVTALQLIQQLHDHNQNLQKQVTETNKKLREVREWEQGDQYGCLQVVANKIDDLTQQSKSKEEKMTAALLEKDARKESLKDWKVAAQIEQQTIQATQEQLFTDMNVLQTQYTSALEKAKALQEQLSQVTSCEHRDSFQKVYDAFIEDLDLINAFYIRTRNHKKEVLEKAEQDSRVITSQQKVCNRIYTEWDNTYLAMAAPIPVCNYIRIYLAFVPEFNEFGKELLLKQTEFNKQKKAYEISITDETRKDEICKAMLSDTETRKKDFYVYNSVINAKACAIYDLTTKTSKFDPLAERFSSLYLGEEYQKELFQTRSHQCLALINEANLSKTKFLWENITGSYKELCGLLHNYEVDLNQSRYAAENGAFVNKFKYDESTYSGFTYSKVFVLPKYVQTTVVYPVDDKLPQYPLKTT